MFCGAGGLDYGFYKNNFEIALSIDNFEAAIKTHNFNFKNKSAIKADILELGTKGVLNLIRERVNNNDRIGIIGGPPCQGFSRGNVYSHSDDPRNRLAILYLDIIKKINKEFKIDFIVFENVSGLKDKKHTDTYSEIIRKFKSLKFTIHEKKLNAVNFNVPQDRERIIITALNKEHGHTYTLEESKNILTVHDAINNFPEPLYYKKGLQSKDIPFHPNHWTMQPKSKKFLEPEKLTHKTRSFKKIRWFEPSPTVAYGNREIHVHPNGNRRLSIYEAMRLQGFPKSFQLLGTFSEQVTQVSNAVPPPLSCVIAKAIAKSIKS